MSGGTVVKLLGDIWALPWSLLGWALALCTGCERREGYWRATSRLWRWWHARWGMGAITIGTVVICAVEPSEELLGHEARHQRQARILGPFYVPAYFLGCIIGALRGDWYMKNPMEEDARG